MQHHLTCWRVIKRVMYDVRYMTLHFFATFVHREVVGPMLNILDELASSNANQPTKQHAAFGHVREHNF